MSQSYSWVAARKDLLAGVTVAAISLPQAMAYALIAGIDPRFGLYSAIVVTAVASIFGSSSHLINGPTNAISLVVFSALAVIEPDAHYEAYQAVFLLGIMIGVIQILIAVFKLGDLTRYISDSVVIGFMAGAGFLVALTQIANLFGIGDRGTGHQHVLLRFWITISEGSSVNYYALGVGFGTILLVVFLRMLTRKFRLPQFDMLLAMIVVAVLAAQFGWSRPGGDGKTLLAIVGSVPSSLPLPHVPVIKFAWIQKLSGSAFAIAFLGLLEALAIAKSIAIQSHQALDYNKQCLAEGLANLTGGFFQCLPGSGSLTRSSINYQAGAVTRVSGFIAAGTVAMAVVLFAPFARFIPKAALAGILMVTAARLIDWGRFRYAFRASRDDAILVLVTGLSAVFISVEFSILIGVALSIVLFIPRAARLHATELVMGREGLVRERLLEDRPPRHLLIYDLEGELFFGAVPELDKIFDYLKQRIHDESIRVLVLRVKRGRNPDMVFLERFEHFLRDLDKKNVIVVLAGVRPDFIEAIKKLNLYALIPAERIFPEQRESYSATIHALRYARALLDA